jgi:NADH-quinone oxidoreductase subunit C
MRKVPNSTLVGRLEGKFGRGILKTEEISGMLNVVADPQYNLEILQFLYEDPALKFQFLTDLCGIHYPDQSLPLGVIYHLHSFEFNHRIRLKFFLPLENPHIRSATPLYAGANWMERETYDFFGILFDGHPNLKRILNVDEMEAFPMRKEFPLEDPNRLDKQDKYFGR